jgi:hypothetical protein
VPGKGDHGLLNQPPPSPTPPPQPKTITAQAAGRHQPVLVLNHAFDPEPLEFSVFTAAYHLDICKLKRPKVRAFFSLSCLHVSVCVWVGLFRVRGGDVSLFCLVCTTTTGPGDFTASPFPPHKPNQPNPTNIPEPKTARGGDPPFGAGGPVRPVQRPPGRGAPGL